MSNGRNSGCKTVVPALSVSVSVSVPVSVVCFGVCGRCLFRYLFRFRHRSQAQARITETGTETGTDYRHGLQARITETGTGTDHRDRNRHRNRKNFPVPSQQKTKRPSSNCHQAFQVTTTRQFTQQAAAQPTWHCRQLPSRPHSARFSSCRTISKRRSA